jgi:hypothetical protein
VEITDARDLVRLDQVLRVQARDSAAIRRRLEWTREWQRTDVEFPREMGGVDGCGIVDHFCVGRRTASSQTFNLSALGIVAPARRLRSARLR